MTLTLTLVVLGRDTHDLSVVRAIEADEVILLSNPEAKFGGLSKIGNWYLDHSRGDVVGLIHADVVLSHCASYQLAESALKNGLSGIVGKSLETGNSVWGYNVDPGMEVLVSTLDSCAVFIRRNSCLRFDVETFDSFHMCVEDLCLQAGHNHLKVVVPNVIACHLPTEDRPDREFWRQEHTRYLLRLKEKWAGTEFSTC